MTFEGIRFQQIKAVQTRRLQTSEFVADNPVVRIL